MNLIIFTPVIKSSAIGRMAALVTRALVSLGHKVTVVRTESESFLKTPTHVFCTEIIPWNALEQVISVTNEADALIYQIGNNFEFHQGGVEWLSKLPGIVCLHDFFLGHLFYGWAESRRQQADVVLRDWYGDKIAQQFFAYTSSDEFIEGTRDISPLTEWICSMAYGVITHSNWGVSRVLGSCPGPVHVVPLAYDAQQILMDSSLDSSFDRNTFRILTIGHVNPNKRVSSVIRAIGSSPQLHKRTVYQLIGKIQPDTVLELSALALECQVELVISGEVDDATLALAIQGADVVSCLRWPSLEAASASAIEAMLSGKPTIVTDTGFFSEIPGFCVIKIDPEDEISSLKMALEFLCEDVVARRALGCRGQQWASVTFSPENYSNEIVNICISASRVNPVVSAANYFIDTMGRWGVNQNIAQLEETVHPLRLFSS